MKRPLCFVPAAVLLAVLPAAVNCAPLTGVAPSDWAYRSIASLASRGIIEGYPDGSFRGQRPATRKEMAAVVSRTLAQAEAEAATRSDLDRTGQLIDALKDELDALSVRVSHLEERLGTTQPQSFVPQVAVRRANAFGTVGARNSQPREMVALHEAPSAMLSRADMTIFAAGALHELESRDASKNALEKAQRNLTGLSDKLSLLSARVATLDAVPGAAERPQPMMRTRRGVLTATLDQSALRWARLDQSIPGLVAGISFRPNADIMPTPQYSLVGAAVFGIRTAAASINAVAQSAGNSQSALAVAAFAPKALSAFAYAAPLGGALNSRTLASPPGLTNLLKNSTPVALVRAYALGAEQIASPTPSIALPGTSDAFSSSFAVPTLGVEPYALNVQSATPPNVPQLRVNLTVPARIGGLAVQSNFGLAHLQGLDHSGASVQSCSVLPALCAAAFESGSFENRLQAATTFDVRALGRHVSLNLAGSYAQLHRPAGTGLPYVPYDPAVDNLDSPVAGAAPLKFDPNYVDVLKRTLNAAAAVPISRDLTLNLQYNTEYYTGSYQSFGQSIDERKDSYLGNLTYTIPRTASTIVFSAKQYRYRDAFLPTYNLTQNRADLNFTLKF
ncbi:MAG: S-layer homology domain-containing protein [Candidatus Eremiobacteraeota bacterium]|nr:S-layer homology domain-containing protein [Candidatus Eremiobacteraeota bacterium]